MTQETPELPLWFKPDQHQRTPAGIIRRADLALLAEDGLPASPVLRQAEAQALEAARKTAKKKDQADGE